MQGGQLAKTTSMSLYGLDKKASDFVYVPAYLGNGRGPGGRPGKGSAGAEEGLSLRLGGGPSNSLALACNLSLTHFRRADRSSSVSALGSFENSNARLEQVALMA